MCILCKKEIPPREKTISLAGGFFDPDDVEFFVMDEGVLSESYLHFNCLENALKLAQQPV